MRRHQPWLVVVLVGAVVGVVFAAVSTYDFVQHLDRQVHNLHCSFIPGVSHAGESGCQVAMMSPYSSVMRGRLWGGVPISLPALAVFAFLAFYAVDLMLTRRKDDPRATGFLALATALPAVASLVMLIISLTQLGTTCKLCVGIYLASATCLVGGLVVWRHAARRGGFVEPLYTGGPLRPGARDDEVFVGRAKTSSGHRLVAVSGGAATTGFIAAAFAIGVAFVAAPVVLYLAMAPDHSRFIGTCEGLPHADDTYGVMLRVERGKTGGVPAIEVLDPLCPACKAFEQRLAASGLAEKIERKAVLFPLDNTCNWMVTEATHPGACTVSEAVLCAGDLAPEVIAWAFEVQDRIRNETRADPGAAARIVKQRFPALAACIGSPEARSRLNKSLRWIVSNNLRVLTPQLFVDKVKLCDEDVDLGLEYTLTRMLERHARGALATVPLEKPPTDGTRIAAPVDRPTAVPEGKLTDSPDGKAAGKPDGKSADRLDDKAADRSNARVAVPPDDKAADGKADKPASRVAAPPADKADDNAADRPVTRPDDKPITKPDDNAAEPASKPNSKPADKSGDKPAEKSGEKPADKSGDKPADKSGDKAADKPEDKP